MRIAVVNDSVYPFFKGGAQKRVYEISRRLVQRGHELHWYGMDYGAREIDGIQLHAVSPAYEMYHADGRRRVSQALRFATRLRIQERVDLIDCMNFPYLHCFPAKFSAMILGVPLVITWFEFWGDYWYSYMGRLGWIGKVVEMATTRLATAIIADSEKVRTQLAQVACIDKVSVVPDGVDTQLIDSAEPAKDKYDVIYVGRILAHKNVDVLLHSLVLLPNVTAVVIGEGTSRLACERLARDLGLENRVRFLGRVDRDSDMYGYMKSAKVLVLPSTQEGHPLVLPEANACGIPVIGIRGVCDEFIDHERTGYLSPLQSRPLAKMITCALDSYPNFAEPCREEAKRYDWETIADQVEQLYKELL